MASLILRHRSPSLIHIPNHSLITFSHLYSSSSNNDNDNDGNSPPDFSSYFSKIKNQQQSSPNPNFTPTSSKGASFDEIRKNLSEFRRRSSDSPILGNAKSILNSGQNLNNKNVGNPNPSFSKGGTLSFDKIRESLQKMRENKVNNVNEQLSLNNYKQSFRMKPASGRGSNSNADTGSPSRVIGGTIGSLPSATFGDEIKEKDGTDLGVSESKKFELFKHYTHAELGEKLKDLRPDTSTSSKNKKKVKEATDEGWFSLSELQQRLGKLNEIEQKQSAKNIGGLAIGDLRKGLQEIELSKEKPRALNFDLLTQESSMSPKEHLVEKYFHPDNMSSAEKLKIELKKVRDEFKMSESDCGSTRVQIAQLTTEIHHLSSVLHKKDKHSHRGLLAKVQQRKKLLKYLRRTDWDSYCFVLSKLGLRDNPDYKN